MLLEFPLCWLDLRENGMSSVSQNSIYLLELRIDSLKKLLLGADSWNVYYSWLNSCFSFGIPAFGFLTSFLYTNFLSLLNCYSRFYFSFLTLKASALTSCISSECFAFCSSNYFLITDILSSIKNDILLSAISSISDTVFILICLLGLY